MKALGYVNNLVAGLSSGSKGFDFFIVSGMKLNLFQLLPQFSAAFYSFLVDLTETGIEHIDDIIKIVFQYFAMLRKDGLQEWIHTECKNINQMLFRFKDKESPQSYVTNLASNLREYPIEEVLTGPWLIEDFKPELIEDILNRLIPKNVYIMVVAKQFENIAKDEEKWYGTKYCREKIPQEKLDLWSNAPLHDKLYVSIKNCYFR